ncbi:MAG: hypothetical protein RL518_2307 [Pseudomonadota bacterium]|jgi:hypothetical protein
MQVDVKGRPSQLPHSRTLDIKDIFNGGPLEPGESLVIEEILMPADEYPDTKRGDAGDLTPQKNLSKLYGTFHVDAPLSFEFV